MAEVDYPYTYGVAAARMEDAVAWLRARIHPANWTVPDSTPFDGKVYFRFREAADRQALHDVAGRYDEPVTVVPPAGVFRLHIGGKEVKEGWQIFDIQPGPGVDHVGDVCDLGRFPDGCCDEIYISHVVEHIRYGKPMQAALKGFHRILRPGGTLRVSVPDIELLCRLFVHPEINGDQRFHVMRIMFGGHVDEYDVHMVGLNMEFLVAYLEQAGFTEIARVEEFGLFDDSSSLRLAGNLISLNVEAVK